MTRQVTHSDRLIPRELLCPKGTPEGAPQLRAAWARTAHTLIEVVEVARGGKDVAYIQWPGSHTKVKSADELAVTHERLDGSAI